MANSLQTRSGIKLALDKVAFASGGEGDLFKILSPSNYTNRIVKIYKSDKRTKERQSKVEYLINNPLNFDVDNHSVIWIEEIVFDSGNFAGIILPYATGVSLEYLCHIKRDKRLDTVWQKFDFKNSESVKFRCKICFNIAVALYHIHNTNKYVLVDMKPENIIIQSNGLISIIDIDSIGVFENAKILFKPPVTTPEYTPPEYYNKNYNSSLAFDESWDRFSMAVIFYRLLCGIHPFTGSCNQPYNNCNGLPEMVENGLFPNGPKKSFFKIIPPPHSSFYQLDSSIQALFTKCFVSGHNDPFARPTAEDWCKVLAPPDFLINKRKLPSNEFRLQLPKTNSAIKLERIDIGHFPNVNFLSLGKFNLTHTLKRFLMKTKFDSISQGLQQIESEIKSLLGTEGGYYYELENIYVAYDAIQKNILDREKFDTAQCVSDYKIRIGSIEEKVKKSIENENLEKKNQQIYFDQKISEIKREKQKIRSEIVEIPITQIKNQKNLIEIEYTNLNNKKNTELDSSLKNVNKLSMYSIDKCFESIFGFINDEIKLNLKIAGFITAADILDVTVNGEIKNKFNKFIKVPTIAAVRGKQLRSWKNNLEKEENRKISKSVDFKYNQQILIVYAKLKEKEKELNVAEIKANSLYQKLVEKMRRNEELFESQKKLSFANVTTKFDNLNNEFAMDASIIFENNNQRMKQIHIETAQKLTRNFHDHNGQVEILHLNKSEAAIQLRKLINDYEALKMQL